MAKKSSKRWKERHQEGRVAECAFRGALKTWLQYKGARRELGTWLEPWLPGKIVSLAMRSRIGLAQRVNKDAVGFGQQAGRCACGNSAWALTSQPSPALPCSLSDTIQVHNSLASCLGATNTATSPRRIFYRASSLTQGSYTLGFQ